MGRPVYRDKILVVPRAHRRQGWGSRLLHLLQALAALHPGRPWFVPPTLEI